MSTPPGWYDDGSGRRRWWDGQTWTDHFAPEQHTPALAPPPALQISSGTQMTVPQRRGAPVLGPIGLGLAVVGTVLACLPVTFIFGVVVLLAAFVLSLIGLFAKNTAKWPSIAGTILSIVGGAIGTLVTLAVIAAGLVSPEGPITLPTDAPSPTSSEQPSTDPSDSRPVPEEIAEGFAVLLRSDGITDYEDMPDYYPCMGQQLYDSNLPDEPLRLLADGQDVTGPEREAVYDAIVEAGLICDPEGEGLNG
ncbi:DUF2510 domain-containing protein [Microbacterium sp. NPDC087868]|uniref:DUF2510 domain-containing protein n=1 Tax=Microbacterium sp. NPDC087868 TaxID=3364195 RepID=UPI003850879E